MAATGGARLRLAALLAALLLPACGGIGSSGTPAADGGDELIIVTATPGTPPPRAPAAAPRRYVVEEGDTLSGIAARFGVEEDALRRANGIDDPDSLFAGQELAIPTPEP